MSQFCSRPLRQFILLMAIVVISAGVLLSTSKKVEINSDALAMFAPLPPAMTSPDNPETEAKVKLGRMLYYEPRLSADQKISCNTCHALDSYGAEPMPVSVGFKNQHGTRNAPTVYNAAGHFVQFWDGRASTVEEQAKGPITNPIEMGLPSSSVAVQVLKSIPEYQDLFHLAFPNDKDPVTYDNMALAIGAFERGLVTPARWDAFLKGDQSAITDAEKAGFNTFASVGCQWCHNGAYVGGGQYQKLGVMVPWPNQKDRGRYQVTKDEVDVMVFKVPSLRNVEMTAPYFHDGSVATLSQAIRQMGAHQRGAQLSDAQVKSIATWMKCLTGPIPTSYIAPPALPKSTPQTPPAAGK